MAKPGRKPKLPSGLYRRGVFLWMRYTDVVDGVRKQVLQSTGLTESDDNIKTAIEMLARRLDEAKIRLKPELATYDIVKRQFTYHKFLEEVYFKSDISRTTNFPHVKNCLTDVAGTFVDVQKQRKAPLLGNKKMCDIDVSDLIAWSNYQSVERQNSKSTRNRHRAYLRKSFKYACSTGYYDKEKLRDILEDGTYVQHREPSHPRQALTHRQLELIIDTAKELYPHVHEIIQVAVLTGWRQGRIYGLRWKDVDFERMIVKIPPKSSADGGYIEFHISEPLKQILDNRHTVKRNKYVFYNPATNDRWRDLSYAWSMILHRAGIRQHPDKKFIAAENRRLLKAGLPKLEEKESDDIPLEAFFHALRHTFASSLVSDGVDILIIQKLLGHTNLATTQKYLMSLKAVKDYSQSLDSLGHLVGIGTDLPDVPDWYDPEDDGSPPEFIESDDDEV